MWEKIKFAGRLVVDQLDEQLWYECSALCECSAVEKRKEKKRALVRPATCGFPPPPHIIHSLYISIYTYSRLSSRQVPLCSAEGKVGRRKEGGVGGKRRRTKGKKGRIAAFSRRGRSGGSAATTGWWRGKEARNRGTVLFHQQENAEEEEEEERGRLTEHCFVGLLYRSCNLIPSARLPCVRLLLTRTSCGSWPRTRRWCAARRWRRARRGGRWRRPDAARRDSPADPAGRPGSWTSAGRSPARKTWWGGRKQGR